MWTRTLARQCLNAKVEKRRRVTAVTHVDESSDDVTDAFRKYGAFAAPNY